MRTLTGTKPVGRKKQVLRPALEHLEGRCLLSRGWFDAPWRAFETGTYPQMAPNAIAAGDLDGDGDVDVVVGRDFTGGFSNAAPGVSVLKNRGNGSWDLPVHYNLPAPPARPLGEVSLSDLDGNGTLDVLATVAGPNGQGNRLAVWRNAGDGTLTNRTEYPTGNGPMGLVVADFTGDGFPDAVTANYGRGFSDGNTVSLLVHNGQRGAAAGFLAPRLFPVGPDPLRLAAADLNGDSWLDLAVGRTGNAANVITVLFNTGGLDAYPSADNARPVGFSAPVDHVVAPPGQGGGFGGAVALADLDGDGDKDLIGATSLEVQVRLNAGNGTFGSPTALPLPDAGANPPALTLADVNGDGRADVLTTTPNGRPTDGWYVLLGNGTGGFRAAAKYEAAKQTFAAVAADTDNDGDQDVLTVANDSAVITVHTNPGNGVFAVLPRYEVGTLTDWLDAADLDRDGDLDIVTTDDRVRILRNNGDGTFAPAQTFIPPRNPYDVKLRDLNGDGYPDLVLGSDARFPPYDLVTALNRGDGSFLPGTVTPVGACQNGSVDTGDFDNDGDLDVVLTEEGGCSGGGLSRLFLFRNNGTGGLTLLTPIVVGVGLPFGVVVRDVNQDGNPDILSSVAVGLGVWLGNGDLTFRAPLVTGTRPYRFTLADMNRDGLLDMALLVPQDSFGTISIGVSLGNGDGTFRAAQTFLGATGLEGAFRISTDIDTGDVNGDGFPDVVVSNNAPNDISLFLSNGDGTLARQERYGAGYGATAAFVGDFTGDGLLDVVPFIRLPLSGFGTAVVLLRGQTPLGPQPGGGSPVGWESLNVDLSAFASAHDVSSAAVDTPFESIPRSDAVKHTGLEVSGWVFPEDDSTPRAPFPKYLPHAGHSRAWKKGLATPLATLLWG